MEPCYSGPDSAAQMASTLFPKGTAEIVIGERGPVFQVRGKIGTEVIEGESLRSWDEAFVLAELNFFNLLAKQIATSRGPIEGKAFVGVLIALITSKASENLFMGYPLIDGTAGAVLVDRESLMAALLTDGSRAYLDFQYVPEQRGLIVFPAGMQRPPQPTI